MRLPFCVMDKKLTFATPRVLIDLHWCDINGTRQDGRCEAAGGGAAAAQQWSAPQGSRGAALMPSWRLWAAAGAVLALMWQGLAAAGGSPGWFFMFSGVLLCSALSPLCWIAQHALPFSLSAPMSWGMALMMPSERWSRDSMPPAPDYVLDESWFARPGRADSADLAPCVGVPADGSRPHGCGDGRPGYWRVQRNHSRATTAADVFFVPPTSYYGIFPLRAWNAPAQTGMSEFIMHEGLGPQMASIFSGAGQIWVPKSRQMTAGGFWSVERGRPALDAAYQDIRAAFRYFLRNRGTAAVDGDGDGEGGGGGGGNESRPRPLILAGHSQGTTHAMRLLAEEVAADPALCEALVAAYLPGMPVYERVLTRVLRSHAPAVGGGGGATQHRRCPLLKSPLCRSAGQTGCVISWRAYVEGGDPAQFLGQPVPLPEEWAPSAQDRPSCINPLTWLADTEDESSGGAAASLNPGSVALLHPEYNWRTFLSGGEVDRLERMERYYSPLRAKVCGAVCRDGSLWLIDGPVYWPVGGATGSWRRWLPSAWESPGLWHVLLFPGLNAHSYDYQLFYLSVRHNVEKRLAAYMRERTEL
jgi:hypothetical protein